MADILGTVGMLMLLGAFLANALGRLRPDGVPYQALNAVGAGVLAWYSVYRGVWIFAILEGVWCAAAVVALARALMAQPKLLLLDEPSLGLAPLIVNRIFDAIARLKAAGTTILLVEQNARKALGVADRAYVLETGRVVLAGPAGDLAANSDVERAYLGG